MEDRTKDIENRNIIQKKLFAIAIPIMLSNLISQVQMLIDRIFIGRLDITAMSAVSNATSPIWTTMNVVFSLSVGSAILISQAIGAGEKEKAKGLMASLYKYANIPAVLLFLVWLILPRNIFQIMGVSDSVIEMSVSYARFYSPVFVLIGIGSAVSTMLQVSEQTGVMVLYGAVRSLINIVLDYALVFGHFGMPRLEVAGAAIATAVAELIGDLIILVYVILKKDLWLKPTAYSILSAKLKPYIDSIRMGLPTACEDFAWNLGSLYLIIMLNRISASAAGVYSIVFGVELLPVCIIASMGSGVLTLAGQETGKKNYKGVATVAAVALKWAVCLSALILLIFAVFPYTIIGWFTADKSVVASSVTYLIIVGIDLFPKSGNILVGSSIKGYGDTRWMLGTQIFGTIFVIGISSILVIVFHLGIAALFCLVVADETIRCCINCYKLNRIKNRVSS